MAVPVLRPCPCLWTPCRCEWIEALTPEQRNAEQEFLVQQFWRNRAGRIAAAERRRRELVTTTPAESFNMAGHPTGQPVTVPPLSGVPNAQRSNPISVKSRLARESPCAECRVNDGRTVRLQKTALHPGCERAYVERTRLRRQLQAKLDALDRV